MRKTSVSELLSSRMPFLALLRVGRGTKLSKRVHRAQREIGHILCCLKICVTKSLHSYSRNNLFLSFLIESFSNQINSKTLLSPSLVQFLWPFQAFSNSRGHQMLTEKHLKYTIDPGERAAIQEDDPHALRQTAPRVLDQSLTDSIDFEYFVGPWSACSQTCGSASDSGYRVSNDLA